MVYLTDEARTLLDAFKEVMVEHTELETADQEVALAVEEHADAAHLLLFGPTGVGKSTVLKTTTQHFMTEAPSRDVVPVIFLEARTSDTDTYVRMDYYRQVLTALKGHILVKEMLVNIGHLMTAPKATRSRQDATDWLDLREAVEKALCGLQVKAVMIDEAQHLMQGDGQHHPDAQLNWLKSMSNSTNVLHILSGPYELFSFRNLSGQAARRGDDIHFPRYHMENKAERAEFVGALVFLLERVPLECDTADLLKRWRWFAEGCVGCVGILKTWLVKAIAKSFNEGNSRLTVETLESTMLHPAKRVRLEMEARAGEHEVHTRKIDSDRQLQILLGKANKETGLPANRAGSSQPLAEGDSPQVFPKPTQPRVGQRGLGRDPVGEASAMLPRKSASCLFTEVIDLLPTQMHETTITRVECPACFAVRDIQPKGSHIKFPKHPQRVTNTPNQGWRWVKRESSWELAE